MERFRVHHVKFYQLNPKAIHCLAYEEDSGLLAVVRSDFSVEIWNLNNIPYQEEIIVGNPGNSVEAIVWCNQRLFSAGLHSYITEYDLLRLAPKHLTPVSHGPTWCLSLNKQKTVLAAGTENGYICLFSVTEEGLNFQKTLNKQEGRILCLAWHESGETIVTGSTDIIRIWNVETGRAVDRIIVDRIEQKTEAIVWCIAVTRDFVIVSGDSLGRTSFWDGKTGTLINAVKVHKADVLTMCLSKDENIVYVGGVDPIIVQFSRISNKSNNQEHKREWIKSIQRIVHTHDVRALLIVGEFLVSGGCDTYLVLSKFPPKTRLRYPPFPQRSCCHVAIKSNALLLQYPQSLELWELGSTKATSGKDGDILPFSSNSVKALQIKCKEKEQITCSAISDDGHWLAYSTPEVLRLFHFDLDSSVNTISKPSLQKVEFPHLSQGESRAALCLKFTPSGSHLIVATKDGNNLQVWKTDLSHSSLLVNFKGPSDTERFHLLAVSSCGHYVAAGDHGGRVIVYNIEKCEKQAYLPHYKCQPSCLAFDPVSKDLIVVYTDKKVVEYNIMKKAYTLWTRQHSLQNYLNPDHMYPITGITFHSNNKKLLILHDDSTIYVIDRTQTENQKKKSKKESSAEVLEDSSSDSMLIRTCKKYEHLISFQSLQDDFVVAVEIPSSYIMDTLPPPLRQKKYGT